MWKCKSSTRRTPPVAWVIVLYHCTVKQWDRNHDYTCRWLSFLLPPRPVSLFAFYRSVSYNFSGCVLKDSVFRQENKPKDTLIEPWFLCHSISANSCWVWNRPAGAVCFWEVMWFTPIAPTWRLPGGKKKSGEVWARWPEACDSGLLGSQASQFWLPGAGLLEGSCSQSSIHRPSPGDPSFNCVRRRTVTLGAPCVNENAGSHKTP